MKAISLYLDLGLLVFSTPNSVSWLPVISNSVLAVMKLAVAMVIGSVSVLSDGLDTSIDVLSAFIAFVGIRVAAKPPDAEHPYGHGKAEYLSGMLESALILGGGGFIVFQAIQRIIVGVELEQVELGIAALAISLVVNVGVSFQLYRVAKRFGSVALEAAAKHRASDMLTSLGVLLGLVAVKLTGVDALDPIIALGVALVIFWAGSDIVRKSVAGLMDSRLEDHEEAELTSLMKAEPHVLDVKHLHTGQVGTYRRIEATVTMCRDLSVGEAHAICDRMEAAMLQKFPKSWITVHVEPCGGEAGSCNGRCAEEKRI
jgi:cation diffusion facilitator family transporter